MTDPTCPRCKTTKPREAFNKSRIRSNGLDSSCRECMSAAAKKRRDAQRNQPVPVDRQCIIDGCERRRKSKVGWCETHNDRAKRRGGDPFGPPPPRAQHTRAGCRPSGLSLRDSFKWFMPGDPPPAGEPWLWTGPTDAKGYGHFKFEGRKVWAHRVSYELFVVQIPDGLIIRHKNDTPLDVNPHNLEVGTRADNRQDCVTRGRTVGPRGEKQHQSKLTADQVRTIRARYIPRQVTQKMLAEEYGVQQSTISKIVRGVRWDHLQVD